MAKPNISITPASSQQLDGEQSLATNVILSLMLEEDM